MLTPKRPEEVIASCVLTLFSTQTRTRGGWSEREAKEATVIPKDFPSCVVVTIVTPLAKCDMASLKSASVTGMAAEFRTFVARREAEWTQDRKVPWYTLYYKANYPRLQQIKARRDPPDLFLPSPSLPTGPSHRRSQPKLSWRPSR